jgi:hypothetical protein
MSRLDSFIRRLEAQRACLDAAAAMTQGLDGVVLEFGLGNGRTYDHLRAICPKREIFVFDRQVAAHPDCIPPKDHMFVGDFADTLPLALQRLGPAAILAHADLGSGDKAASEALAQIVTPRIRALMRPGGVLVSDQAMMGSGFQALDLPAGVKPGRYHLSRAI